MNHIYILRVEEEDDLFNIGAFTSPKKAMKALDEYLESHGYTFRVADWDGKIDEECHLVAQIFGDVYADILKMEVI